MTIYVVNQDGRFRASFLKEDEAMAYMAQRALRHPQSKWTIDEYEDHFSTSEK